MIDLDELIAEAREAAVRSALWDIPHLLFRLADALEDVTRVPVPGEPNDDRETLHVSPSIQAVRDYLDQLEDWEAQNHVIEELLSLVDDIPCCESATAMPHDEHNRATVPDAATELRAERDAALARIAEAAKLHRPILASWMKGKRCDVCLNDEGWNETWPCPTAVALGLNEGENK